MTTHAFSQLKLLARDSIIYGLGGGLTGLIGLAMMAVYTRVFLPADYGRIDFVMTLVGLAGTVLAMGLDAAQTFYYFEVATLGRSAQARVVSAIMQWRLMWALVLGIGALIFVAISPRLLQAYTFRWDLLIWLVPVAYLYQTCAQFSEIFRYLHRPWSYLMIHVGHLLLSFALTLAILTAWQSGTAAYVAGYGLAAALVAVWGAIRLRDYIQIKKWHSPEWPRLLRFGLPFVPEAFLAVILMFTDRWFIAHFRGAEALGIYAVGAKLVLAVTLAVEAFRLAWMPIAMKALRHEGRDMFFRTVSRAYLGVMAAAVVALTAGSKLLTHWFTSAEYAEAYVIVGVLAWQAVFLGFYAIIGLGVWKEKKTYWAPVLMAFATACNIGLNFWWVPRWGALGAAAATSASYLIWNIAALILNEILMRVRYPMGILIFQLSLGVGASITIMQLLRDDAPWIAVVGVALTAMSVLLISAADRGLVLKALAR